MGKIDYLSMIKGLENQMNFLNNQVKFLIDRITPTTDSKQAYIGDTELIFDDVKEGNVSVFATTESGKVINTITDKMGNSIRVSFDALEEVATVTISVL